MSEVRVPELAESITEATIINWLKSEGDQVAQGDVLAELETDKVNVELNAEQSGRLAKILREPGDTVQVGEVIAILDEGKGTALSGEAIASPEIEAVQADVKAASPVEIPATPAARRLARERGIDLNLIKSQDPLGRVTVEDLKADSPAKPESPATKSFAESRAGKKRAGGGQQTAATNTKPANMEKSVEHMPMSKRRQTIANRLVQAQHNAAMLTTFNEVDMTAILDVRKRRQEKFMKEHNIKLGFMSFFTKAVVGALKAFPLLNAEIKGDEILIKKYYDIGIAVAANEGLVVPVVREADRLNFAELELEIANLAEKARNNQLHLSDLQGGTFTITNGGVFGSLLSTPILNAPQVGILGMHKIQLRPVAIDKERSENRPMMYIALSYDHRIVDGKEAVSFLVRVKELLEDPETLLLEG
ncbi:2-oxoglutarate dehydrogenase complex dihydrolipoyllysine-residue succinyltransferase [Aneurinibacillus terranovensis]|uniref:2-oxoglutarate dehydrogenase complex dihydrolipoyllysine-residue succinyltransferase n=1 Tax=Aneurinibacillus terranovensis TaxID=278991 RepID=UPI000411DDC5|nr:2-oxoglutarate dehydrogenase complex dihydrolipoyllysine-residue succinyltransferase [Aneurinibacillus terranovensis]